MVAAEDFLYEALGPDYDIYLIAKDLISILEIEGCLATDQED